MSLRFGLYLVEQGIISCDQFCGLVRIQQQMVRSPSTIAVQENLLTMRQVAHIYKTMEKSSSSDFLQTAEHLNLLNERQSKIIQQFQQLTVPTFTELVVDCGLMNLDQAQRLYRQFENIQRVNDRGTWSVKPLESQIPSPVSDLKPREPKFRQRPIVVQRQEAGF